MAETHKVQSSNSSSVIPPEVLRLLLEIEDEILPPGSNVQIPSEIGIRILEKLPIEPSIERPSLALLESTGIQTNHPIPVNK